MALILAPLPVLLVTVDLCEAGRSSQCGIWCGLLPDCRAVSDLMLKAKNRLMVFARQTARTGGHKGQFQLIWW